MEHDADRNFSLNKRPSWNSSTPETAILTNNQLAFEIFLPSSFFLHTFQVLLPSNFVRGLSCNVATGTGVGDRKDRSESDEDRAPPGCHHQGHGRRQSHYEPGVRRIGGRCAGDTAMHFPNGAVAFAYLGTLLMEFVDEHKVKLDDTIDRWMPTLP